MMRQSNEDSRVNVLSLAPFLRLEGEYPEETEILEIQVEIGKAPKRSELIEGLIQKHQEIIDLWIERVEKELNDTDSTDEKEELERELDRTKDYKNVKIAPQ
jgi:hypothetical protein